MKIFKYLHTNAYRAAQTILSRVPYEVTKERKQIEKQKYGLLWNGRGDNGADRVLFCAARVSCVSAVSSSCARVLANPWSCELLPPASWAVVWLWVGSMVALFGHRKNEGRLQQ